VKALREEAAGYRRKLRDTEGRLKTLEEQQTSGAEHQDRRLKEMEEENARLLQEARFHQVERAAMRAGAVDPGTWRPWWRGRWRETRRWRRRLRSCGSASLTCLPGREPEAPTAEPEASGQEPRT
jgi:hypothetical protein